MAARPFLLVLESASTLKSRKAERTHARPPVPAGTPDCGAGCSSGCAGFAGSPRPPGRQNNAAIAAAATADAVTMQACNP
jgi:hypothetical protein